MTMNFNSKEIAISMAIKIAIFQDNEQAKKYPNIRECPAYSECFGITQILKMMNVPFSFDYNEEVTKIINVTVCDTTVNVNN